jgi:hypothetical protein
MFDGKPMSERMKAMRNRIAERALARGRNLTPSERLDNLESGLGYKPGDLRKKLGLPNIYKVAKET